MSPRLADRLSAVRRSQFVGRQDEMAEFQAIIAADRLPYFVLHVYGPGGVGKTTLLKNFGELSLQSGLLAIYIDGRHIDPTPPSLLSALQNSLELSSPDEILKYLDGVERRAVLLIDTYETIVPLDEWLRSEFLPSLPENVLVVIGGRLPPSAPWRADAGWQALTRTLPLRNLSPDQSRALLEKRAIPTDQHQAVLDFTHGHPLALSLVADVFAQRPEFEFVPEDTPDIIQTLVDQFVQKVPGPAHRAALEACALVRVTTEALLARMLDTSDVHSLFEWLRGLSFIDARRGGVFPHDLARDALIAELRWRNPDWYAELHRRARGYYTERLTQTSGQDQQRNLWDFIFLHRDNPSVRPYFEWQASGAVLADSLHDTDMPALEEMVGKYEGPESAALAGMWLQHHPENVIVLRDNQGQAMGFFNWLSLEKLSEIERARDPACQAAWEYLRHRAPVRPGEVATYFRYWMAADSYQGVSPIQSIIFVNLVRHYLTTPGLAYHFLPCADPDFWAPGFTYGDMQRLEEAAFTVGGRRYGVFGHDWRARPPLAWLDLLAEREIAAGPLPAPTPLEIEPLVVLSREDFEIAVREAFRAYAQPDLLASNPLVRSRLVLGEGGANLGHDERVKRLRGVITQAVETLRSSPKQEKLYRALDRTYLHPAPTQEVAAELLDLPFSTYRRHLKAGIDRVADLLWQREVGN